MIFYITETIKMNQTQQFLINLNKMETDPLGMDHTTNLIQIPNMVENEDVGMLSLLYLN